MSEYNAIINLPHHRSSKHPYMSRLERAAQFSPFAALTGYDGAVKETARLTDRRIELDEDELLRLDEKLRLIRKRLIEHPEVGITFFVPDDRKDGGAYVTARSRVRKIKEFEREIILDDGMVVPISEIVEIEL